MDGRADEATVLRALHGDIARVRDLPTLAAGLVHLGLAALCVLAWQAGQVLWLPPLWLAWAWSAHAALARLHEAVHWMLSRSQLRNELHGLAIGTLAWTPLSVYRHVHARHHAHLGRPADPEFRPYSLTGAPLWLRRGYAWAELLGGFVVTPALYTVHSARPGGAATRAQAAARGRARAGRRLLGGGPRPGRGAGLVGRAAGRAPRAGLADRGPADAAEVHRTPRQAR
jgi:fatty acid desaturase